MNASRPGILSVRAVNQYRRRDILTYLSLRYYLDNIAARTDPWAKDVATHLVLTRHEQPYFHAQHFKGVLEDGVEHRPIFLPGANEALAEAALLEECSKHQAFLNPTSVFSYQLSTGEDRSGVFQPYFGGLQRRHKAITEACEACPNGEVLFIDIKRFYPSIQKEVAMNAWDIHSEIAGLNEKWRDLGKTFLQEHVNVNAGDQSFVLTGPMFSHLIGNLVLRNLDEKCMNELSVHYFRYVDDITLVGDRDAIDRSLEIVRGNLKSIGFDLHDELSPKTIRVSAQECLKGRSDFHESHQIISWMTLIGDLKKFLLQNPSQANVLHDAFRKEEFRIPVHDYSGAVFEAGNLERAIHWAKRKWFRRKSQAITINSLLVQARHLRKRYEVEFLELIDGVMQLDSFNLKRRIPKLRYRAGRLIYLASDEVLKTLASASDQLSEIHFHSEIMRCVATGDITSILSMGTNVAQAASQPMRSIGKSATHNLSNLSPVEEQALAIFILNGIQIKGIAANNEPSELMQFALGSNINLMKDSHPFMRELACLHGVSESPRHAQMLESVYDVDEALVMDAIDQLQQSASA